VTVCEAGPRDGLQNESVVLPVEVKAEFVERLVDAGHTLVETTSFVPAKWVPQLADADELLEAVTPAPGVRYPVLAPNERGLDRALDHGVRDIAVFGSVTETFAKRNLNRTVDESPAMFALVVARAREADVRVRGYRATSFDQGRPPPGDSGGRQVCAATDRCDGNQSARGRAYVPWPRRAWRWLQSARGAGAACRIGFSRRRGVRCCGAELRGAGLRG
jgi:hydroxymethylglutaryl-CoA lyase